MSVDWEINILFTFSFCLLHSTSTNMKSKMQRRNCSSIRTNLEINQGKCLDNTRYGFRMDVWWPLCTQSMLKVASFPRSPSTQTTHWVNLEESPPDSSHHSLYFCELLLPIRNVERFSLFTFVNKLIIFCKFKLKDELFLMFFGFFIIYFEFGGIALIEAWWFVECGWKVWREFLNLFL